MLLKAEFAIKRVNHPGILWQSHGVIGRSYFERMFEELNVGTPPKRSQRPAEAAPWVVFGGLSLGGTGYAVAIREDYTGEVDSDPRSILASCCFCFPFESTANSGMGYARLSRHLLPYVELVKAADEGLPDIEIPINDDGDLIAPVVSCIDALGFDFVAGAAALLLETRVAIVDGNLLGLDERLAALDAFSALLPYGIRAALKASVWAQSGVDHNVHLTFSDAARPNQQKRIEWGQPIATVLRGYPVANEYYQNLCLLKERHSIRHLVEHLASLTSPLGIKESSHCLTALTRSDEALSLWRSVRDDPSGQEPRQVIELFKTSGAFQLSTDKQEDLLRFLLRRIDDSSVPVIKANWRPVFADDLANVADALFGAAHQNGRDPGPFLNKLRALVDLASGTGQIDGLLAALLRKLRTYPQPSSNLRSLVRFLASAYSSHPETQASASFDQLLADSEVLCEHILQLCEADRTSDARRLLAKASRRENQSPEMRLLDATLGASQALDAKAVGDAARLDPEFTRRTCAIALGQPSQVAAKIADFVTAWLVAHQSNLVVEEFERWSRVINGIASRPDFPVSVHARVHILAVVRGKQVAPGLLMRLSGSSEDFQSYLAILRDEIAGSPGALRATLWISLVNLLAAHSSGTKAEAENVLYLLSESHKHVDEGTRATISRAALRQIKMFPEGLAGWLYCEPWSALLGMDPDAVLVEKQAIRAALRSRLPPADAAERCARFAMAIGDQAVEDIVSLVAETSYFRSADEFWRFVAHLRWRLSVQWPTPKVLKKVEVALQIAVRDRRICTKFRKECRERAIESAHQEWERAVEIGDLFAEGGGRKNLPAIGDTASKIVEPVTKRSSSAEALGLPRRAAGLRARLVGVLRRQSQGPEASTNRTQRKG